MTDSPTSADQTLEQAAEEYTLKVHNTIEPMSVDEETAFKAGFRCCPQSDWYKKEMERFAEWLVKHKWIKSKIESVWYEAGKYSKQYSTEQLIQKFMEEGK
jgi:hypothetical protein